jgi:hypothetical protein
MADPDTLAITVAGGPRSEPVSEAPPVAATIPAEAVGTARLAKLSGISERAARKRIADCHGYGLPGFYRVGRAWRALPDDFARFRMSSDRIAHVKSTA